MSLLAGFCSDWPMSEPELEIWKAVAAARSRTVGRMLVSMAADLL